MRRIVVNIARMVLAVTLILSGFVKAVDPMGTQYKIADYLQALHLGAYAPDFLTLGAAVLLSAIEFALGIFLLFAIRRRVTTLLILLMMLLMTPLTLWLAVANRVSDCGCFGDALVLTNWQTFWKNVVLDVPTVWIVLTCGLRQKKRFERDIIIAGVAVLAMVVFGLYNINHEPCIDFRAWKVGNRMVNMDPSLEVKSYVTYRNAVTGETEEMLSSELVNRMADPEWEENWEWESSRVVDPHEIMADGFSMLDADMNDHAQELIASEEPLMIITIHHLEKVNAKGVQAIQQMVQEAEAMEVAYVLLTSSLPEEVEQFLFDNGLEGMEYYFADATAIETMLRSNPGFLLMQNGEVKGKWHYKHLGKLR